MEKIGTNIRKIRELRNYSRVYMAKKLNLSTNTYGKIERNEVRISVDRLQEIAKVLKINPVIIVEFDEEKFLNWFI